MTRTEYDGSISVLMDRYEGKRLSSPNDVVVKSDGSIWFTDSPFGIMGNYEDYNADPELGQNVYRLDPDTGSATVVVADVLGPNGLASSPDESTLYLVEPRGVPTRKILAFDVTSNGTCLQNKRVLIDAGPGTPDGFRVDVDGNLWCGWGMGRTSWTGSWSLRPMAPRSVASCCRNVARTCVSGGRANSRLFMAASTSIHALYVNACGVAGG